MYLKVGILLIVVAVLSFILMRKPLENFSHHGDECGFFYEHTLSNDANIYLKYLVTKILERVNKEHGTCFQATRMDRVAIRANKTNKNELHYKLHYFVSEWEGTTNRKLIFELVVNEKENTLVVVSINNGASLDPLLPRQKEPERQSILYKPPSTLEVTGVKETSLEHASYKNKTNEKEELLNRNRFIDIPSKKDIDPSTIYPMRMKLPSWNLMSIHAIDEGNVPDTKCMKSGIFHGVKKDAKPVFPTLNPTLFGGNNATFDWLFSLTEDSASRPIGIA